MKLCNSSIKKYKFQFLLLLLFPIWPFGSFALSCFNIGSRITFVIFILFYFLIGCCFLLTNELVDSYRYAADFQDIISYDITFVLQRDIVLGKTDFYSQLISFMISKISHAPRFLFGCFGAIFGLLQYQSLKVLSHYKPNKHLLLFLISILVVVFLNPHTNINGVRYWTATWCAFSSICSYNFSKRKIWLVIFMSSPLIHSSFIIVVCLYFIACIFKNRIKLLAKIAILSMLFGLFVNIVYVISLIPDDFGVFSHYSVYADSEYVSEVIEKTNERSIINNLLSSLPVYYAILIIYTCFYKNYTMMKQENKLIYALFLVMVSFVSIFGKLSSIGRFYTLSWMLLILSLSTGLNWENISKKIQFYLTLLVLVFFGTIYNNLYIHSSVLDLGYLYKSLFSIIHFMKGLSI